ncbi:MAG: DNA mismatch repair protein MutL, partial [Candidatus Solibacter usitatus]|nr:DNA mismatch repair protein MutL [Candidatus Solibacter usitatus]
LRVTPVATLRERVYQVFGSRALDDLIELDEIRREIPVAEGDAGENLVVLNGFFSRPQVQKSNRNSIYLFVNRRLIRDKLLLHALTSAYHNLIPPNAFPFALLFLDCPPSEVDVNVHPSKTEVRFQRGSFLHDFVRDSIRESLMRNRPVSSLPLGTTAQPAAALPFSEFTERIESAAASDSLGSFLQPLTSAQEAQLPEFVLRPESAPPQRFDFADAPQIPSLKLRVPDTHGSFPEGAILDPSLTMEALRDLRPLGQLQESFIIAAGRDGLWIIDQHVAHERILFEKVLREWSEGKNAVQTLLVPLLLELTPSQQIEYDRIREQLLTAGFETEPLGNRAVAVTTVPAAAPPGEAGRILNEILEIAEGEMRRATSEDLRRAMAASIACRAAIKINTPLDAAKIDYLMAELAASEYPMSCPHGRPVALRYAIRDILKGFHRI